MYIIKVTNMKELAIIYDHVHFYHNNKWTTKGLDNTCQIQERTCR